MIACMLPNRFMTNSIFRLWIGNWKENDRKPKKKECTWLKVKEKWNIEMELALNANI